MQIPEKFVRLVQAMGRRGPRQLPLNYGPGFLHVQGATGAPFGFHSARLRGMRPHISPGAREGARGALNAAKPYLRKWVVPGALLTGGAGYAARNLETRAQARADGVRAYGHFAAGERAIDGQSVVGAKAKVGLRAGKGFHAGIYAKGAKRQDGGVTKAGRAGVFLRSKPVGAYWWVGGREKKSPHTPKSLPMSHVPAGGLTRG